MTSNTGFDALANENTEVQMERTSIVTKSPIENRTARKDDGNIETVQEM